MFLSPIETLLKHIANRNTAGIIDVVFQKRPLGIREGFFREDELWDYKEDVPSIGKGSEGQWANIASDVLAFHNNKGGVLIFGIRDRDYRFVGATHRIDTKLFNDKIRRYVGDRFWVSFSREFIQYDQRYVGVAIIPPKVHSVLRAMGDAPVVSNLRIGRNCARRLNNRSQAIEPSLLL